MDFEIKAMLASFRALACIDCGKCTASCPVARHMDFSPRLTISRLSAADMDSIGSLRDPWDCLTCGMCTERCPADVKFSHLVKELRCKAAGLGAAAPCSHAGALHSMMRLSLLPREIGSNPAWLAPDLKTSDRGKVLYHPGCVERFDIYFGDLSPGLSAAAAASVRILNRMGVVPAVIRDEKCCGHDLLWSGDAGSFRELAAANVEAVRRTGAETVVCSCAECYYTMKHDFPAALGPVPFRVMHISEFMKAGMETAVPAMRNSGKAVTFHDPCRLGRLGGVYSAPREVLSRAAEVREMEHSRHAALCCGTSSWVNCNAASMAIQKRRLGEAVATGAGTLVTACPKCRIHFLCAQKKNEGGDVPRIEIRDFTEIAAEAM